MKMKPETQKEREKQKETQKEEEKNTEMSSLTKAEQIGFHKGALSTLSKERAELLKLTSIVEEIMKIHVQALKELGVDILKENNSKEKAERKETQQDSQSKTNRPIEDLL